MSHVVTRDLKFFSTMLFCRICEINGNRNQRLPGTSQALAGQQVIEILQSKGQKRLSLEEKFGEKLRQQAWLYRLKKHTKYLGVQLDHK